MTLHYVYLIEKLFVGQESIAYWSRGTMKSNGLVRGHRQYYIKCTWWLEIALDSMRHGRARGLMPGASVSWHVMQCNVGEPEKCCIWSRIFNISSYGSEESQDWCLWSGNFYISSDGSGEGRDCCLWSSVLYVSSYGSWVSLRAGTLGRIHTAWAMKRLRVGAIGHLVPCGDRTFSYSSSSSCFSFSSSSSYLSSSFSSTLAIWCLQYSSGLAASLSVCMSASASSGLGQKWLNITRSIVLLT